MAPQNGTANGGQGANPSGASADQSRLAAIRQLLESAGEVKTKGATTPPATAAKSTPATVEVTDTGAMSCTTTSDFDSKPFDGLTADNDKISGVVYPGALIQGATIGQQDMTPFFVDRGPGRVSLYIGDTEKDAKYIRDVKAMDPDDVNAAIHALVGNYVGVKANASSGNFSTVSTEIHSQQQLALEMDVSVQGVTGGATGSLSVDASSSNSYVLTEIDQPYYTIVYTRPPDPAAVFGPKVTTDDLSRVVKKGNPAVYVPSVTYGRRFYLLFTSSMSSEDLKTTLDANMRAVSVKVSGSASKSDSHISVTAYAVGGGAQSSFAAAKAVFTGGVDGLSAMWEALNKGAEFGRDNPGLPISYKMAYLTTGATIGFGGTAPFDKKTCTQAAYCPVGYDYWDNAGNAKISIQVPSSPVGTKISFDNMRWSPDPDSFTGSSTVGTKNYSWNCALDATGHARWTTPGEDSRIHERAFSDTRNVGPAHQTKAVKGVANSARLDAGTNDPRGVGDFPKKDDSAFPYVVYPNK